MTAPSLHAAFGMRALNIGLKAKAGVRVTLSDAADLAHLQGLIEPADPDSLRALRQFCADYATDAAAAGEALLRFLDGWRDGAIGDQARRAEDMLSEAALRRPRAARDADPPRPPPPRAAPPTFDWQTRADTGID